jgi:hypothetical protein
MRALSWIGYILAAILVLCIGTGIVGLVALGLSLMGALVCISGVIVFVARMIRGLVES